MACRDDRAAEQRTAPTARPEGGIWKRPIYWLASAMFFLLGVLGVILPGLPATPFLLLTSYFLVRSSPRLNAKLLRSRIFGPILRDWQVKGGVQPAVKMKAISIVVLTVALSIYLSGASPVLSLAVASLAAIGIFVIIKLPHPRSESDE